jgi:hypothetical protein
MEITNVRALSTDNPTTVTVEILTNWHQRNTDIIMGTFIWNGNRSMKTDVDLIEVEHEEDLGTEQSRQAVISRICSVTEEELMRTIEGIAP